MQTQAKPVSPRAAKMAENKANKRVEAAYYARCRGITINVMDISKVFDAGKKALAVDPAITDEALAEAVFAFVQTIRKN